MVIGAFPAAKLGGLLLKQVSKPIAQVLKNQAKSSPIFRKYVCMPPAQFYNWCEIKSKMWILNLGKPVNVPVLNEEQAIELGANLLGEAIIFIIAAGILINEYNRSSVKEAAKEKKRKEEVEALQTQNIELFIQGEEQAAQIREMWRKIGEYQSQIEELSSKMGVKHKKHDDEPQDDKTPSVPPYSPVNDDPNLNKMTRAPSEIYQLKTIDDNSQNSIILLKSVDDILKEFWGYSSSSKNRSEGNNRMILNKAVIYLSELLGF